jgi:hypothetical protein
MRESAHASASSVSALVTRPATFERGEERERA